jgi:hypothetical protein
MSNTETSDIGREEAGMWRLPETLDEKWSGGREEELLLKSSGTTRSHKRL